MKKDYIFISESVTEGHPDKLCDQISDSIVDQILMKDRCAKIRAEVSVFSNILFIAVRFASESTVDFPNVARSIIKQVGYKDGFNAQNCSILTSIKQQKSSDFYCKSDNSLEEEDIEKITVSDPTTVFGYACNQTQAYMPLPIWLAHKLARRLSSVRYQNIIDYLEPDGKTQVSVEYRNGKPYRIDTISIIASQSKSERDGGPTQKKLYEDLYEKVILPSFLDEYVRLDEKTRIIINPEGPVVPGGPLIHAGLTGRKNAIDTYGEYSRNNSTALSGKDPSRIDRIGTYMARNVAKNIVASGIADECEVQLTYSIGYAGPISIHVETFGTGKIPDEEVIKKIKNSFDLRFGAIIKQFSLRDLPTLIKGGFYRKLAAYGHVGRMDIGLPWEKIDKIDALRC